MIPENVAEIRIYAKNKLRDSVGMTNPAKEKLLRTNG